MRAQEIHENLGNLSRQLVELLQDYQRANRARAEAEARFKVAHAEALLRAEGAMEQRKAEATAVTRDLLLASELAAVEFDNIRAALRVLGQRLDAGRTIASTVRAEAIASGVGQP